MALAAVELAGWWLRHARPNHVAAFELRHPPRLARDDTVDPGLAGRNVLEDVKVDDAAVDAATGHAADVEGSQHLTMTRGDRSGR